MSLNRGGFRLSRKVLFLSLIICLASVAVAQRASKRPGKTITDTVDSIGPQLLNADTNPTLRYPIASFAGMLYASMVYGWLDISHAGIHFQVVQPPGKLDEAFDATAGEVSEMKISQNCIKFRLGAKKHTIFYLDEERWGSVRTGPAFWDAASLGERGTGSIYNALSNFDSVLAQVKAATPPPQTVVAQPIASPPPLPQPATPSSPPVIVLAMPAGARPDQVVELNESPLVVRGVAMDSAGIPVVTVNGMAANMRPQNTQATEFWSDPLPLQPGNNPFQISASDSARGEAKLIFTVHYTPKTGPPNPRALGKEEILALLHGGVANARIVELVKERGLKFSPTADDLKVLRAEGGSDELIQAIEQAAAPPK